MKKLLTLTIAAILCFGLLAGCGSSAKDDTGSAKDDTVYELIVVNSDSATSLCQLYMETLCNQMSEASGGRLTFTFYPGGSLLSATEEMDGVKDRTADICWAASSFNSGRFPVSEFINLCGNGIISARMGTEVYQRMYEEIPELQAELSDWIPIAIHASCYGPISTINQKIETADDFKGLQIRAGGVMGGKYVEALGATPVSLPATEVYEAASKGVIDGFTNDWHSIEGGKLYETVDYCLNLPFNVGSNFVMMNKAAYEELPDDLQAVIDQFAAGYASDMAGYWWDSCTYRVADKMRETDVELYDPSPELLQWAKSDEVVAPIHEWYIQYLNDAGLDGQAIYDKCMEIVEEVTPAHVHDWDVEFDYTDWNADPMTYGR